MRAVTEAVVRRCSAKKGVLINFAKFTGKHLCQSLFLIKLQACKISKKTSFHRAPPVAAFGKVFYQPNRLFPNLILFQILLFHLYVRKFVVRKFDYSTTKRVSLQNFKPIFAVVLQVFHLECHGEASLKVAFVLFGLVFMTVKPLLKLRLSCLVLFS